MKLAANRALRPDPPHHRRLSLRVARRIALAAQGFGIERRPNVTQHQLTRMIDRLSLHQIDSVNVLARAHYLPDFSRLGAYDRTHLDRMAWGPKPQRKLFEYWAHEASLLPFSLHPLLRWRMEDAENGDIGWASVRVFAREKRSAAEAVLKRVREEGPLTASDLETGRRRGGGWWEWSDGKRALEWLFWAGHVTTATRRRNFERVYDLTERVIPRDILHVRTPSRADAQRALIERSASSLGVGTARDLRDYFRLSPEDANRAIAELVEERLLIPVLVEGWRGAAFMHHEARTPRRIRTQGLLAPFDPLVWHRERTERLFGFRYRIEIYTPSHKRVHGYYVLPFLLDDGLVARVDLKADRQSSRLLVRQVTWEPLAPPDGQERLDAELRLLADWLDLETVAKGVD